MKQWITLIAFTAIVCSCSKEDLQEENLQQDNAVATAAMRSGQQGTFVSGWEQYNNWIKTDVGDISFFTMTRSTPEVTSSVTNGGLVLSYAKISSTDPTYSSFAQPKMLPFYFLPEAERVSQQVYYFSDEALNGKITISYRVAHTSQTMPTMPEGASLQGAQFQFVVLTKEFLDSRGLSANTVRNYYTYDQVMNLVSQ